MFAALLFYFHLVPVGARSSTVEHLPCTREASGSNPDGSIRYFASAKYHSHIITFIHRIIEYEPRDSEGRAGMTQIAN